MGVQGRIGYLLQPFQWWSFLPNAKSLPWIAVPQEYTFCDQNRQIWWLSPNISINISQIQKTMSSRDSTGNFTSDKPHFWIYSTCFQNGSRESPLADLTPRAGRRLTSITPWFRVTSGHLLESESVREGGSPRWVKMESKNQKWSQRDSESIDIGFT